MGGRRRRKPKRSHRRNFLKKIALALAALANVESIMSLVERVWTWRAAPASKPPTQIIKVPSIVSASVNINYEALQGVSATATIPVDVASPSKA